MGRQEPRSRLPGRGRRFGFHTETRNWRSVCAPDTGRTADMRRPVSILQPFASGDGCRGFRQAPRGGSPAGILTGMPTTADNRGLGLEPGWSRYDDGHCRQAQGSFPNSKWGDASLLRWNISSKSELESCDFPKDSVATRSSVLMAKIAPSVLGELLENHWATKGFQVKSSSPVAAPKCCSFANS